MTDILQKLEGGDLRSVGRVEEVVVDVLAEPELFAGLFEGMQHENPLIRMRSADACEKITVLHPEYLQPYKRRLIEQIAWIDQQEVRWHVAQMFSRLELGSVERREVLIVLNTYLRDRSRIVCTFALQAMADLALQEAALLQEVIEKIEEAVRTGSPAMQSRGRKLLVKLKQS